MTIEHRITLGPPDVDIAALAEREGLLDVAIAHVDSPIGDLLLAQTPNGLLRLSFFGEDATLEEIAARVSPRIIESPKHLDPVRRQLDEYFDGRRDRFDVAVDWALVGEWGRKVLGACAAIPFGETRTYGEIARALGVPAQAVGQACGANPIPIFVRCHRVVGTGSLGGYSGGRGIETKAWLLRHEGAMLI